MEAIKETNFSFPGQSGFYRGKVRDVYFFDTSLVMVASDRISAFDVILPKAIPFKGQVLNQIAEINLKATEDIVPNWLITTPDPNVSIGIKCDTYPIEMVIRGYLTGHAWREYESGKREICGVPMPDGMKEHDMFPEPIITPATKAEEGHDEDISRDQIIKKGIISEEDYIQLEDITRKLFQRGTEMAEQQGLILVDTKYEFGKSNNTITLIDEIHTPDSSRYFYVEGYKEKQNMGLPQKQLSKEFVREWLISENFQGLEDQVIPPMSDDKVLEISARYQELFEKFTGQALIKENSTIISERIHDNILNWLKFEKS
jgi:phosphoribosylaminoimidazole-succinocarboxamide synthase